MRRGHSEVIQELLYSQSLSLHSVSLCPWKTWHALSWRRQYVCFLIFISYLDHNFFILLFIVLKNMHFGVYWFWWIDFIDLYSESIYRRGARRWRKLYYATGHAFQAKRFNRVYGLFVVATLNCYISFSVVCSVYFNVPVPVFSTACSLCHLHRSYLGSGQARIQVHQL